jgi:hypothetical protein
MMKAKMVFINCPGMRVYKGAVSHGQPHPVPKRGPSRKGKAKSKYES